MRRIAPALLLGTLILIPAYGINVEVDNYASYINSSGSPVVAGEVVNHGSSPVRSVEVKVSFIDGSGKVIDSGMASTAPEIIPPGQRAPFMLVGGSGYASRIQSYELQIVNFAEAKAKPAALHVTSSEGLSDGLIGASIWGELENTGKDVATSTKVYATFYDSSGKVIGYDSAPADVAVIKPGGKSSFTVSMNERTPSIMSYTLFAESDQYSLSPFEIRNIKSSEAGAKVSVWGLSAADEHGAGTGKFAPDERIWIRSDLRNELPIEQEFTYIVQVKDADGLPVTINWVDGVLTPNMSMPFKISWVPEENGIYFAEVFVWKSLEDPIPLSMSIRTIILLVAE